MSPVLRALRGVFVSAGVRLVETSARTAPLLLPAILLLTGGLLYYTKTHLALNSNTAEMLDPNLPFRQMERELERAFPQLADNIVVVVEAETPAEAGDVADALAERIRLNREVVESVYQPGGGPFFAQHGLLYLDRDALWDLDERFAEAEPFLGTMAEDPSLRGLFTMLGRAFGEDLGRDTRAILQKVLDRIARPSSRRRRPRGRCPGARPGCPTHGLPASPDRASSWCGRASISPASSPRTGRSTTCAASRPIPSSCATGRVSGSPARWPCRARSWPMSPRTLGSPPGSRSGSCA